MTRLSLSAMIFGATVTVLAIGGIFIGVYYEGPYENDSTNTSSVSKLKSVQAAGVMPLPLHRSVREIPQESEHSAIASQMIQERVDAEAPEKSALGA